MAINTELPISKVTLDDQELSLASSGGGSGIKKESFTNIDTTVWNSMIDFAVEKSNNGTLLDITLNIDTTFTIEGISQFQFLQSSGSINQLTTTKNMVAGKYVISDMTFTSSPIIYGLIYIGGDPVRIKIKKNYLQFSFVYLTNASTISITFWDTENKNISLSNVSSIDIRYFE